MHAEAGYAAVGVLAEAQVGVAATAGDLEGVGRVPAYGGGRKDLLPLHVVGEQHRVKADSALFGDLKVLLGPACLAGDLGAYLRKRRRGRPAWCGTPLSCMTAERPTRQL
ncbi:hypothetical protein SVIOM74S_09443 [Streptomyces violarus]